MKNDSTVAIDPKKTSFLTETFNFVLQNPAVNVGIIERLASLALGATVVFWVVRRLFFSFGLAVAGGYLLYRGLTGYCPLYASEQIDTRHWHNKLLYLFNRSKNHEQNHTTGQMASYAWQPKGGVGQAHG